jgi:hypothetical protein
MMPYFAFRNFGRGLLHGSHFLPGQQLQTAAPTGANRLLLYS